MQYLIKSGVLSDSETGTELARIKNVFRGAQKVIFLSDSKQQYQTDIREVNTPAGQKGDARFHIYTLSDRDGKVVMEAHPGYVGEDEPDIVSGPVSRLPLVDHARIVIDETEYLLLMQNSQNYSLLDTDGAALLQVLHRGISGGWALYAGEAFPAPILCGLFLFCRYIEQENEFVVV